VTDYAANCLNCGAELQGKFCHACGQKASSVAVGFHDFVHEATHEFLHLDGKILQTVKLLLFKPGQLTVEFLAGRRARYISPLRVYLTFSVLFFALAAFLPGGLRVAFTTTGLQGDTAFERRLEEGFQKAGRDPRRLGDMVLHNFPRAMFVLMPTFGLLTWAFYRRHQRFYIPHLYYSVHFHAFAFVLMSLYLIASRSGAGPPALALMLLTVPYHFVGLRRVFGGSRTMTFLKGTAIGVIYWMALMATVVAVMVFVLLNL
jgi:hypothetical protein